MATLFGFAIGASCVIGFFAMARWFAGRLFGAKSFIDALMAVSNADAPVRVARAGGGIVGWYVGCAVAAAIATMGAGVSSVDDLRVTVVAEGPAARAGIKNGDSIVAVESEAIRDWDQLGRVIGRRAGETTRVTIRRDGVTSVVETTPDGAANRGRILVKPLAERRAVGIGEALGHGLVLPAQILGSTAKYFARIFGGGPFTEVTGPVAVLPARRSDLPETAIGAGIAVEVASRFWPLVGAVSVFLVFFGGAKLPRGRSSRASGDE